ncbi:MAG UNVERIFIED_CONTAM: hypothetical protein LVR18_17795 [Planctomycetaceae bacterium]|jgi:hypothetical protein
MKYHPQRFIHAANLRLDVPVSVISSEQLSEAQRTAFEDATLRAFDQVIDSCIRHKVLYLLLSGNAFTEADRSLRARLAILRGFERLREHQIRVFVLPGDSDPPEAWRAIADLPENVTICLSSSSEPAVLEVGGRQVLAVSASMWLGHTDDFGIQVISSGSEEFQPFRIGVISQARCDERQRMQALAAATTDDALTRSQTNPATGELVEKVSSDEVSRRATAKAASASTEAPDSAEAAAGRISERYEAGERPVGFQPSAEFLNFADELLRDARLNYLAFTGQLERSAFWRECGVVHNPGTPQPRSRRETTGGCCSLVHVSESGEIRITALDTSCVDWHVIELEVDSGVDLSTLLQIMKTRLLELRPGTADQYWSVQWVLRGDLPDLEHLRRSDLSTMLAVELDELEWPGRKLQLLHDVRFLPDAWPSSDPPVQLADQYQQLMERPSLLAEASLAGWIERAAELSAGWKQRLQTLLPSLDREQILARIREDGGRWFEPRFTDDEELLDGTGGAEAELRSDIEESADSSAASGADSSSADDIDETEETGTVA